MVASSEDVEVVDGISHAEHPVVAGSLVYLYAGHAEAEHARRAVLELCREVVLKREIYAEQRRERLVDAHHRDVEHRTRYGASRRSILNETEVAVESQPGAIALVGADTIDALIAMVDVDTLEKVAEPRQL